MEYKNSRKYNTNFRKKLINKIELLKNEDQFIEIYYIIINDIGNNYSSNRNGVFINMNILSDYCIEELTYYLERKLNIEIFDKKHNYIDNDSINNSNKNQQVVNILNKENKKENKNIMMII
jgi:hypothetical protein